MADRNPSGLGDAGRDRFRRGLGTPSSSRSAIDRQLQGNSGNRLPQVKSEWETVDSSRIKAYQYDYDAQQLRVRFHKYDTPWVYEGVPASIFEAFASSPSKGRYVNTTLNHFDYRRATATEVASHFDM